MVCKECKNNMRLDDTDMDRKKIVAKYYCCDYCNASCIVEYWVGIPYRELWHIEDGKTVKDYEILME